jgi:hypothetical protein
MKRALREPSHGRRPESGQLQRLIGARCDVCDVELTREEREASVDVYLPPLCATHRDAFIAPAQSRRALGDR